METSHFQWLIRVPIRMVHSSFLQRQSECKLIGIVFAKDITITELLTLNFSTELIGLMANMSSLAM